MGRSARHYFLASLSWSDLNSWSAASGRAVQKDERVPYDVNRDELQQYVVGPGLIYTMYYPCRSRFISLARGQDSQVL